jgi:hypothetical protein
MSGAKVVSHKLHNLVVIPGNPRITVRGSATRNPGVRAGFKPAPTSPASAGMTMGRPPTSFANFFKPKENRMFPASRSLFSFLLIAFLLLLGQPAAALAATKVPAKRVLIIDSFGRDIGPFNAVATAFRTTLTRGLAEPVDVDEAPFDTARFAEPKQEAPFVDFLQNRYGGRTLDLVVPINFPALSFVMRQRKRLFPETPMLITATDQRRIRPEFLTTNTAVVPYNVNLPEIVEGILQVLPDTKNIVVVLGTSPLEKFWLGEFRREFQQFANRVSFTWFDDLSFEEMKRRAAALPAHSAIFYFFVTRDAVWVFHTPTMQR